jgi:hypothetical protein
MPLVHFTLICHIKQIFPFCPEEDSNFSPLRSCYGVKNRGSALVAHLKEGNLRPTVSVEVPVRLTSLPVGGLNRSSSLKARLNKFYGKNNLHE